MRWPWTRGEATDRLLEPIDTIDLETLEVVEIDTDGHLVGASRWPSVDTIPELPDRPSRRDATGTAGIWEALAHH